MWRGEACDTTAYVNANSSISNIELIKCLHYSNFIPKTKNGILFKLTHPPNDLRCYKRDVWHVDPTFDEAR